MSPLIEHGHIWIAKPPLYKVSLKKSINWEGQSGKELFIKNDEELKKFTKKYNASILKNGLQRFKGLGELNAEQLAQTVMDRDTRNLSQVNMEDFDEADNLFEILFGKDTSMRYDYIQQHSDSSYAIDV